MARASENKRGLRERKKAGFKAKIPVFRSLFSETADFHVTKSANEHSSKSVDWTLGSGRSLELALGSQKKFRKPRSAQAREKQDVVVVRMTLFGVMIRILPIALLPPPSRVYNTPKFHRCWEFPHPGSPLRHKISNVNTA